MKGGNFLWETWFPLVFCGGGGGWTITLGKEFGLEESWES